MEEKTCRACGKKYKRLCSHRKHCNMGLRMKRIFHPELTATRKAVAVGMRRAGASYLEIAMAIGTSRQYVFWLLRG
jgi:hypothetical protein